MDGEQTSFASFGRGRDRVALDLIRRNKVFEGVSGLDLIMSSDRRGPTFWPDFLQPGNLQMF